MLSQRYFQSLTVGDQLPKVVLSVDQMQMFYFSIATYNGHRIHFDREWAASEGHRDLVVQGKLQAALMVRCITDWMGPEGRLLRFAVRNVGSAFVGDELSYTGTVTDLRPADHAGLADIEIQELDADGVVLMPGRATVALPLTKDQNCDTGEPSGSSVRLWDVPSSGKESLEG